MKIKAFILALVPLLPLIVQATPTPVARWSGDANATDPINGNNGTLQNGATYASGKWGQAFSLDGTNDVITVPSSSSLNAPSVSNAFTICLWVKWSGNTSVWGVLPVLRKVSSSNNNTYTIDMLNSGKIGVSGSNGTPSGTQAVESPAALTPGQWYHIAGSYDGTQLKLYIDGTLVASKTCVISVGATSGQLYFGRDEYAGCWFGGLLDEIEIYDQALTLSEIQGRKAFNLPPTANAGPDRIEYVGANTQASITLSGLLSTDPENYPLTYVWSGSFGTATGASPTVTLPLGIHEVELDVADEYNQISTTMMHIAIVQGVSAGGYAAMQAEVLAANNQVATLSAQNAVLTAKNATFLSLLEALRLKFVQIETTAVSGREAIDAALE